MLEVGSYDVNGSVRPIVEALRPASYLGVDQQAGPGVDHVVSCVDLPAVFGPGSFDLVLCTEMLEHVVDWRPCIAAMVDVLAPNGKLLLTTRSPGFPYHPFPIDTWRYSVQAVQDILLRAGLIVERVERDPGPPGVCALALKPFDWRSPWPPSRTRSQSWVFDGVAGVTAMAVPS